MFRKIVVGYAADRHGDDALVLARLLASAESVDEVLIVEAGRDSDSAARRLAPLMDGWPPRVTVSSRGVSGGSPAEALSATADSERADILVLGSSHRGFAGRVLIGTTAGSIFPGARWPVVIAPRGYAEAPPSLRRVGVAFDGSKESEAALRWAADAASAFSARIRLLAVVEPPPPPAETWGPSVSAEAWDAGASAELSIDAADSMREGMRRELEAAQASVGKDVEAIMLVGDARHELREQAEDLDMLVVGSHGRGRVAGVLMGSVSRGLAHSCPVPLAVMPTRAHEAPSAR